MTCSLVRNPGEKCRQNNAFQLQVKAFLSIISDTHNLTLAAANATTPLPNLTGLPSTTRRARGSGANGPGPNGPGPNGPGPNGPGPNGPGPIPHGPGPGPPGPPPGSFDAVGCSDAGYKVTGELINQGLSTAVAQLSYDNSLFSYVGCRCAPGYDNVYSVDATGQTCNV